MPVDYDDFDDVESVQKIRRSNTDIVRQDSSVELKYRMRTGWAQGEHLWGEDYNDNMWMVRTFSPPRVWRWSLPYHPWTSPIGNEYVARDGTYADLITHVSPGGISRYIPLPGMLLYAKAERLFLTYTGEAWKPAFFAKRHPKEIEISLFATRVRAGQVCASYVAAEPFELRTMPGETFDRWSRFRTNRSLHFGYLLKNGVEIGNSQFSTEAGYPRGRVSFLSNVTTFEVGDVLSMRAPAKLMGMKWMNFTLLGNLLK